MPINRNALIRFRTIDKCLTNRFRQWSLNDLIESCSEALYEYEGIDKGVSKRTIQADIQLMRSDKLGYNAPIIVVDRKYYIYEDPDYSITNIPLNQQDLDMLHEVVGILDQFKGFSYFQDLTAIVKRLENKIQSFSPTEELYTIDFEKNEELKGLSYLENIHQFILNKTCLLLDYQPFNYRTPKEITFHPYLLKEYRNRWFILGYNQENKLIMNCALDRINDIKESENEFIENTFFDPKTYFNDVIGVSVPWNGPIYDIIFRMNHREAPYIITKPLHSSQEIIKKDEKGIYFKLRLKLNYELEREFMSLGEKAQIIEPSILRDKIRKRLEKSVNSYLT